MTSDVAGRIVNSMAHQFMCGVLVVQVSPGAQERVRPCCLRSGRQSLIRILVPGRVGPSPRQLFPIRTGWRHSRASARGGINHRLNSSIGELLFFPEKPCPKMPSQMPLVSRKAPQSLLGKPHETSRHQGFDGILDAMNRITLLRAMWHTAFALRE